MGEEARGRGIVMRAVDLPVSTTTTRQWKGRSQVLAMRPKGEEDGPLMNGDDDAMAEVEESCVALAHEHVAYVVG